MGYEDHLDDRSLAIWRGEIRALRDIGGERSRAEHLVQLAVLLDSLGSPVGLDRAAAAALRADLREVLGAEDAVARFRRPAVLHTDHPTIVEGSSDWLAGVTQPWPPAQALWTSPEVEPGVSAWTLRAAVTGDAIDHRYRISVDVAVVGLTGHVCEDLDAFDGAVRAHGSVWAWLRQLRRQGTDFVGFPWLLVLEAEVSVLAGERSRGSAPAHLGVESTLWLRPPVGLAVRSVTDGGAPR
jgi:hypothetical protein